MRLLGHIWPGKAFYETVMFKAVSQGIFQIVGPPEYGHQDVGISPAGCMDRFSYETGNLLLGNPEDSPAMEIILAPILQAQSSLYFVLTGAGHEPVTLATGNKGNTSGMTVEHGRVTFAPEGSRLIFGSKSYGFRTYLCWREADADADLYSKEDIRRGTFEEIAHWPDPDGMIRVLKGPEYRFVPNPEGFTGQGWEIAGDSNQMGLRLMHTRTPLTIHMGSMISAPVSDGTVQLTPKGPIVLLRHRQTIGGYPRIFNVIGADVDLLAQYMPGQIVRFKIVDMDTALAAAGQKRNDLMSLKSFSEPQAARH